MPTLITPSPMPDDPNPYCSDCGADLEASEDHEAWCDQIDWLMNEIVDGIGDDERAWYGFYAGEG